MRTDDGREPEVLIESFGFLHPDDPPHPLPALLVDLRHQLRDPYPDPALRELTGKHPAVIARVLGQPAAATVLDAIRDDVLALLHSRRPRRQTLRVRVGCQGGRHRSVAVADAAAQVLAGRGVRVRVEHRHITRPVVHR